MELLKSHIIYFGKGAMSKESLMSIKHIQHKVHFKLGEYC